MQRGAVRWFWVGLWGLAVGLLLLLLFVTLAGRPIDPLAVQHFPEDLLLQGRRFTREVRLAATLERLAAWTTLLWLCFSASGSRILRRLEAGGLMAVAAGVALLSTLVELPFAYYLGFLHEQAYGLTRQTPQAWLVHYLLGVALNLAIALALWAPLYLLIRRWPRSWWAPGALLQFAATGLLIMLSPVLLMPIFNEIRRVEDPRVLGMVERLAARAGVRVEAVQEMRVSAETSRVNAMVTGLGMTKRIIFYDTLLEQFAPDEVEVVLAHELAHAIHRDVIKGWILSGAVTAAVLGLAAWMLREMVGVGPLGLPAPHAPRGVALLILLTTLAGQVTAPAENLVTRRMEVRADRFALEMTKNPEGFVRTFKRLAAGNPGDVDPPAVVEFLAHSHPSIMHRIRTVIR